MKPWEKACPFNHAMQARIRAYLAALEAVEHMPAPLPARFAHP